MPMHCIKECVIKYERVRYDFLNLLHVLSLETKTLQVFIQYVEILTI